MSERLITLTTGEYYHVYNRGNSKQIIFLDNHDKMRFIKLLLIMNQTSRKRLADISKHNIFLKPADPLVAIGAYVIMDNHYHILLQQLQDDGVTKFMQKVGTAYSGYFNKKYKRSGSLYESKFKSRHIDNDIYFKYLYSYIHLNPAKIINQNWKKEILSKGKQDEILIFLQGYKYSSFMDYMGIQRPENSLLQISNFPPFFKTKKDNLKNIINWLSLGGQI